jgi:hypothetical protein
MERKGIKKGIKMALRTMAIATATFACAAMFSLGWSALVRCEGLLLRWPLEWSWVQLHRLG